MKLRISVQLRTAATILAVVLAAQQQVLAIDDLEMNNMNRGIEIGVEGSVYVMQPLITPAALPNVLTHPATVYIRQPHIAASIYQLQPQISPVVHEMAPEINPNTFESDDLDELAEPVYFNRPLDYAPSTYYNRPITGHMPRYYAQAIPFGRFPTTFNIVPVDPDAPPPTPGPGGPDGPDGTPSPPPTGGPWGPDGTSPAIPLGSMYY